MKPTELPPQVYEFLAWLSHQDFVIRDRLPQEYEAPLAVARATNPPLVHIFDSGIVDEHMELPSGKVIPLPPHFGVRLTRDGSAVLAHRDMQQEQPTDSDWPIQAEVARGLNVSRPTIRNMIDRGDLRSNGRKGADCRVDPESIIEYCRKKGVAFNEGK